MVSQVLTRISVPASRSDWYRANVVDMEFVPPPRTIQALHNEHIYMSNLLDSLEEQVALIAAGRDADFHLLLDIIDYMQSFPERFHHPKEDLIFQRMALRDEHSALDVQAMMAEHKVIEKLTRRLAASIDEVHVLPTVLKKRHVAELCAEYVGRIRQHMNREEAVLLPRAIEVLRQEDWFLIEQQSTPIHAIPIENVLSDNYTALTRFVKNSTEKVANKAVLAEFLSAHALLEVAGSVSAGIAHAGTAYRQGVSEGWHAYWQACKSWLPLLTELDGQPGFQNPVRSGWRGFKHGALAEQRPEVLVISPLVRALKLYVALIGGRTRPL